MTTLTQEAAIAALRQAEGNLTQQALIAAGLDSRQATLLGRILDRVGCSEKVRYGRRVLLSSVEEAVAELKSLSDPLKIPVDCCPRPYLVTYTPRTGTISPGDRLSYRDVLYDVEGKLDGTELKKGNALYRIYRGVIYRLEGAELTDRGFVKGATMIRTDP
jgi:hypothetical protein